MAKNFVNLLQPELFPEQPLWTLARVVALWVVVLVLMLAWVMFSQSQVSALTQQRNVLQTENDNQTNAMATLEAQIQQHKPTQALVLQLASLKTLIENKKSLHQQLTDVTRTYVSGFSTAMTELSVMHHQELSLKNVNINYDDMTFTGVARSPEVVPAWLAGFEKSTFLSGKSFINFTLNENEEHLIEFVVSSNSDSMESN